MKWNVCILTISDTRTEKDDSSGSFLVESFNSSEFFVVKNKDIVKDDKWSISRVLESWSNPSEGVHLILTSGGTGLAPRDVTPEATLAVIQRRATGLEALLMEHCRGDHPMGCLSRLVAGTANKTLIVNFPGSRHAVETCLKALLENRILLHALGLMNDVEKGHKHHHPHHTNLETKECTLPSIVSRPRTSQYHMYEVHEAVAMVHDKVSQLYSFEEEIIKTDFYGRILASDVKAIEPYPNTPVSIKDGYAVISSDTQLTRSVISSVEAGNKIKTLLKTGEVVRITTGAPLPPGADAVVQVEDTLIVETTDDGKEEKTIKITSSLDSIKPGSDVRATGSDIPKDSILFSKGTELKSAELGVLSTAGIRSIQVYKVPSISLLSTGNELIDPSEEMTLNPGFIRDSNKTYLKSLFGPLGYKIIDEGVARDSVGELCTKIKTALEKTDVLITTGGVSMGEKDLLKLVLTEHFKANIVFGRVFMKPGKPMTFAVIEESDPPKFIFALPGNPVSTAVTTEIFVLPALRRMKKANAFLPSLRVPLPEDIILDLRPEFKRVIVTTNSEGCKMSFTGNQISSRLLSCVEANGLLRIPPKSEALSKLNKGSEVEVLMTGTLISDPEYGSLLNPLKIV